MLRKPNGVRTRSEAVNAGLPGTTLAAAHWALRERTVVCAGIGYSTVTDLARLRGWSTSVPRSTATW